MMDVRIVAAAPVSPARLVVRLAEAFGAERIAITADGVRLSAPSAAGRVLVQVMDAVESWLAEVSAPAAEVWFGERRYRLAGPDLGAHEG